MDVAPISPNETPVIEIAPPPVAEMRGLRVLLPHTPSQREIDGLVGHAAGAGINALIVRVYRRGTTLWPSDAASHWNLPHVRRWLGGRDILAELCDACLREGVALCAWVDLLPAVDLSRERWSPLARRHWAWRMRRFTGSPHPMGAESDIIFLCPARPEVHTFLGDVCCELVGRYPFHALWIEGLRYPLGANLPDTSLCHCPTCRTRLRAETGVDLAEMPLDERCLEYLTWSEWREQQLHTLLGELIARVRKARCGMLVMGGVPMGWSSHTVHRAGLLDWAHWAREGYLDLACPMWFGALGAATVAERRATFEADFQAVAPKGRLAPLLPLSDLRDEESPLLAAARALPLSGHVWDAMDDKPSGADWAAMRRVHGERPALVPEVDPADSMRAVISETLDLTAETSALGSFLGDLVNVLQSDYGQFSDAQMGELLESLAQFRDLTRRGEIPVVDAARAERNLDWLQRQLVFLRGRQLLTRGH